MPTKQLKTWAKQSGRSIQDAEKCWNNAKKKADHVFPKGEESPGYWKFVSFSTRQCLGIGSAKEN